MIIRRIIAAARAWWASTHPDAVARDLAASSESAALKQLRVEQAHAHIRACLALGHAPRKWAVDLTQTA